MANRPDKDKFLNDPEFQGERDLFTALVDKRIAELRAEEKKKADDEEGENVFDRWFGPSKPAK